MYYIEISFLSDSFNEGSHDHSILLLNVDDSNLKEDTVASSTLFYVYPS